MRQLNECPDCASTNIVNNAQREQLICRDCGLIYEPLTPALERKLEAVYETDIRKVPAKKAVKKSAPKKKKK